jgi:hypothetical protein
MEIRIASIERRSVAGKPDFQWVAIADNGELHLSFAISDDAARAARSRFLTGQAPYLSLIEEGNERQRVHEWEAVTEADIIAIGLPRMSGG